MNTARDTFVSYLNANYNPIPPRSKAPEVGQEIGSATWDTICKNQWMLKEMWIGICKRLANEILKDPPDGKDNLQEAFGFYGTPATEKVIINNIGHRRMQSPDDGAMVDLVNPSETSSEELFRLADKLESYGNQCIERGKYVRQLAKLRKSRGL